MSLYLDYLQPKLVHQIALIPQQIFVLVANADQVIKASEFGRFKKMTQQTAWCHSESTPQVFDQSRILLQRYSKFDEFLQEMLGPEGKGTTIAPLKKGLQLIKKILLPREYQVLSSDFFTLAEEIAKSSSGDADSLVIRKQEQTALDTLNSLMVEEIPDLVPINEILAELPFQIYLNVAGSDGKIDKNERSRFLKLLRDRSWCKSKCSVQIFSKSVYSFGQFEKLHATGKLKNDLNQIAKGFSLANKIFVFSEIKTMKQDFYHLASEVAKSSGGFGGIGAISPEEKNTLQKIKQLLEITTESKSGKKTKETEDAQASKDGTPDEAKVRKQERFSVTDVEVLAKFGKESLPAQMINMNKSSILCRLILKKPVAALLNKCVINLSFPQEFGKTTIKEAACRVIRANVTGWDTAFNAMEVKIVWQFVQLNDYNQKAIDQILSRLSEVSKKTVMKEA